MIRYLIVVILLCITQLEIFSANNKILVISSYGSDYQWSNTVMDGLSRRLKETYPSIELSREFLSSELLGDAGTLGEKVSILLRNYRKNLPKAIVLVSDEAWMAYRDADVSHFKDVPLILCGVKPHSIRNSDFVKNLDSLRLSQFTPTVEAMKEYNATGVLREMNVPGYLSLMSNLIEGFDRYVFITDSRFYGVYTRLLLQEEMERKLFNIPAEYIDARFVTTDSLLARLPYISSTAGVLLTSWLTGEYGFEASKDYIYSHMENKLSTPIFITNNIGLEKEYFVGGYFNEASFWGIKAADVLIDIVDGKSPRDIKPMIYHDDECHIAWKVFDHYHLDIKNLPARVNYYNRPESFFVVYKYYMIGASVVFLIFILFYLYTLRSNLKLQSAQRLLTVALHKSEMADRLKTAFLANMSHEIRTPLNAIVGFSGVIVASDSEEDRAEYAEIIQRNSDLLLQLISDILDVSKIEAGVLDLTFSSVDALEVCTNVVTSLRPKCKPDVTLCLDETAASMMLYTDPNRLMQVLHNLVNNAIKFTSEGSIEIGYFSYNDEEVEFFVKDTGIGMSKDKLSDIFERFTKLNLYVEGTGLGLSISKTIVEMLGGSIGVESEEGVGSRFWFRIKKRQA